MKRNGKILFFLLFILLLMKLHRLLSPCKKTRELSPRSLNLGNCSLTPAKSLNKPDEVDAFLMSCLRRQTPLSTSSEVQVTSNSENVAPAPRIDNRKTGSITLIYKKGIQQTSVQFVYPTPHQSSSPRTSKTTSTTTCRRINSSHQLRKASETTSVYSVTSVFK